MDFSQHSCTNIFTAVADLQVQYIFFFIINPNFENYKWPEVYIYKICTIYIFAEGPIT